MRWRDRGEEPLETCTKLDVTAASKIIETKLCKEMDKMQMRDKVTLIDGTVINSGDEILYSIFDLSTGEEELAIKGRFILFNQRRKHEVYYISHHAIS